MPEVTGSSSHDGGAVKSAGVFDLHSQKGIDNILKQLRSSRTRDYVVGSNPSTGYQNRG